MGAADVVFARGIWRGAALHPAGDKSTDPRAEYGRFRHAVAAEAIRSVHPARVFTRGEESLEISASIAIDPKAAHVEMRGWRDLYPLTCEIVADAHASII